MIELKSHFDGDTRLAARVAEVLATYRGPAAVMSFDPALIDAYPRYRAQLDRAASSPSGTTPITNGTGSRRAGEIPAGFSPARAQHPAAFHRLFGADLPALAPPPRAVLGCRC